MTTEPTKKAGPESDHNFRIFFESILELIIVTDTGGRVLFTNPEVSRQTGYTAEELSLMRIIDLIAPEKHIEAERIFDAILRGERSKWSLPLVTRNGSRFNMELCGWSGTWDGEKCLYCVYKDPSVEQEALTKFEKLFHQCPLPITLSHVSNGVFCDINRAFSKTLGYARNEVIGKTPYQLGLFARPEWGARIAEKVKTGGHIAPSALQVRRKDGTIIYGVLSGETLEIKGEHYLMSVMIDVTEKKQMEEMIEKERQRLSSIIEGTNIGTWEWNVQTGETVFNDHWAQIVGYTLEELSPTSINTWLSLVHPEDRARSRQMLERHFAGEIPFYNIDCRMKHKDGRWIWVHDRGRLLSRTPDGKPLMMYGTHTDVTVPRNIGESLVRSNRQLHDEIRKRINFTNALVHELKTPLTAILASSEMLLQSAGEEMILRIAKNIYQGSSALDNRIDDLLEMARIEVGSFRIIPKPVNLLDLIQENANFMQPQLNRKSQRLILQMPASLSKVRADPERIKQVLMNLISNSSKYSPSGAIIRISVWEKGRELFVEVEDNGPGISPKVRRRIFEPYYRGKIDNDGGSGGLGLGLAIVKSIVEMHGGRVRVNSRPGYGCKFTFSLPIPARRTKERRS